MQIRAASKGIVTCNNGEVLLVAGKRGMWNLPGGGIEPPETPRQAFLREMAEEVGDVACYLDLDDGTFSLQGQTTASDGTARLACWDVHQATLSLSPQQLQIPSGSEITAITGMLPELCLVAPNMSRLAQMAIRICGDL